MFVTVNPDPRHRYARLAGEDVRLQMCPSQPHHCRPAHEEVFGEMLGYTPEQVARLKVEKVI
jgi:hypothetical protein